MNRELRTIARPGRGVGRRRSGHLCRVPRDPERAGEAGRGRHTVRRRGGEGAASGRSRWPGRRPTDRVAGEEPSRWRTGTHRGRRRTRPPEPGRRERAAHRDASSRRAEAGAGLPPTIPARHARDLGEGGRSDRRRRLHGAGHPRGRARHGDRGQGLENADRREQPPSPCLRHALRPAGSQGRQADPEHRRHAPRHAGRRREDRDGRGRRPGHPRAAEPARHRPDGDAGRPSGVADRPPGPAARREAPSRVGRLRGLCLRLRPRRHPGSTRSRPSRRRSAKRRSSSDSPSARPRDAAGLPGAVVRPAAGAAASATRCSRAPTRPPPSSPRPRRTSNASS